VTDDRRAQEIVDSYSRGRGLYADLVESAQTLLEAILAGSGVKSYSIGGRPKDIESLQKKLARPDRQYETLEAITDLAGLRIITYFVDDVAAVGGVIEREFAVDRANSVDRGSSLDPDRFGYRSVHYVVQFNSSRSSLPEYRAFAGLRFEIQVRSILQHAWAEIEHDLGYKTRDSVPRELRRRFSRLAGLLELRAQIQGAPPIPRRASRARCPSC
jgi:ppGpp synthetase/RelA/SpoT-type nucleotidyltranferase